MAWNNLPFYTAQYCIWNNYTAVEIQNRLEILNALCIALQPLTWQSSSIYKGMYSLLTGVQMLTEQMSMCKLLTLNGNHCLSYNDPFMIFYCIVKEVKKKVQHWLSLLKYVMYFEHSPLFPTTPQKVNKQEFGHHPQWHVASQIINQQNRWITPQKQQHWFLEL